MKALARSFDVVVANPPYMGSSSFNPFMSKWIKKQYPDSCKDLCTAFIERGYTLARKRGYDTMVTMQSWMFLGSFERMRNRIIDEKSTVTMAHLGPRAFDAIGGEVVSVTANVLYNSSANAKGSYFRLVDIIGSEPKRLKLLEAIQNPNCGWFYRADATTFHDIPGSPIAYWASKAILHAFRSGNPLAELARPRQGLATGDNNRFLRCWWEPSLEAIGLGKTSRTESIESEKKWFPCNKGGGFRKWYGNNSIVIDWENDGKALKEFPGSVIRNPDYYFREGMTWGTISSAKLSMRYSPSGFIPETKGSMCFAEQGKSIFAYLGISNSSVEELLLTALAPTLDFHEGPLGKTPIPVNGLIQFDELIEQLVIGCISLSRTDWDSQETSWDFKRNSLV